MKKTVKLTEADLQNIVKKALNEATSKKVNHKRVKRTINESEFRNMVKEIVAESLNEMGTLGKLGIGAAFLAGAGAIANADFENDREALDKGPDPSAYTENGMYDDVDTIPYDSLDDKTANFEDYVNETVTKVMHKMLG